jgi:uncharacterized membrane protein
MLAVAIKLLPQLLCFGAMVLVLLRGFQGRRGAVALIASCGFMVGAAAALVLFRSYPAATSFAFLRDVVGAGFLFFWGVSVATVYRSTDPDAGAPSRARLLDSATAAGAAALVTGVAAGAVSAARLSGTEGNQGELVLFLLLLVAAALVLGAALLLEKRLPASLKLSPASLAAAVVALLLFGSSSITRLDLFSPLTMKVMKFAHDFVHQFFESMLIPDHLFIKSYLWGYIGLLFSKEVGFWGGLAIWFTPVLLIMLALRLQPLPKVSHMRQGAQRRKVLAAAMRGRRLMLVAPLVASLVLAAAVYRSLNPAVEYWDPKPVPIGANAAGEIFIPKKGEIDLEDGKLHKYSFKRGGTEVRFFVLMTPAGQLTVDLDACAICKPEGYGQAEGTVICYYCKTLIPLETVGKPGGCNPVPVAFSDKSDGVRLDAISLVNTWTGTIQSTAGGSKEGGK